MSSIYTSGHRVVIIGDILYVIGGFNPSHEPPIFSSIRRFHLVERKWLPDAKVTGKASPTMASHCATGYGRFILVHGGSKLPFGTCHKRALYAYDTVNHSWTHIDAGLSSQNALPRGIYGHTMHVINGFVYLIGGTSGSEFYNTGLVEIAFGLHLA